MGKEMKSDLRAKLIVDTVFPPGKISKEKAVELWEQIVVNIDAACQDTKVKQIEEAATLVEGFTILDPIVVAAAIRARKLYD